MQEYICIEDSEFLVIKTVDFDSIQKDFTIEQVMKKKFIL